MKVRFTTWILCTIVILGHCVLAHSFTAHGPLRYRNQNPLFLQSPNLQPQRPQGLNHGQQEIVLRSSYSNIFEFFQTFDHEVLIDMEQWRTELDWGIGLGRGLTFDAQVPIIHTGGGFLDAFITGFHNAFGMPNAGRELFANNQFNFHVQDLNTNTNLYAVNPVALGLGDSRLRLHHRALTPQGKRPGLSISHTLELPTGRTSRGTSNGSLDYGLAVSADAHWGRWHPYLAVGYFVSAPTQSMANLSRAMQLSYILATEISLPANLAAHIQIHGGSPLLTNVGNGRWTDVPLDLIVGLSGEHPLRNSKRTLFWQLGFSEDLHANGPSVDFTALMELGLRWGG